MQKSAKKIAKTAKQQFKQQQGRFVGLLGKQYFLITLFWMIFTAMLIFVLYLFSQEKTRIDTDEEIANLLKELTDPNTLTNRAQFVAKSLLDKTKYPIIDFSLMRFNFFVNPQDVNNYVTAWADRLKNINLAFSYVFISAAIAVAGLGLYFIISFKIWRRRVFERKYRLSTAFPNEYVIFNLKIYLDFIISLAIVFTFFNFITTLVAIAYGAILLIISTLSRWIFKFNSSAFLDKKWWKNQTFAFFLFVLVIQNSYTIAKSYFSVYYSIDIDLLMSLIIPIGTITVIVAVFIRGMLNSKVTSVKVAVKKIMVRITKFKIYFHSQDDRVFNDYSFMSDMPTLLKDRFLSRAISNKEGLDLLSLIDDTVDFFRINIEVPEELNYMLYHLFNDVREIAEIEEMRHNILRIKEVRDQKLRKKQKIVSDD